MSPGEYTAGFLDSARHAWTITTDPSIGGTNNIGTQGIPSRLVTIPANKIMAGVCSGLHDGAFWSADSGRVFLYGLNNFCQLGNGTTTGTTHVVEILTDVNGNDFRNVAFVTSGWGPVSSVPFYAAIKSAPGDTVWVWGDLTDLGGSTCAKPTPLLLPIGEVPAKLYAYNSSLHAVCTDGKVYVIGGAGDAAANTGVNAATTTFTQVTGMTAIAYLAKGNNFVLAVSTTGSIYGWGEDGWILKGISTPVFSPQTTPLLLNTNLASILPVDTIVAAHTAWIALKNDSTLWGAGSNETGMLGVGPTINWNTYTVSPSPTGGTPQYWNWDTGMGEFVTGLTQIAKGKHNFIALFGGPLYSFYFFALDANGNLYTDGRDKAAGMCDGMIPADSLGTTIGAAFHVMLNHVDLTEVFPLILISGGHSLQSVTTCPGCVNGLFSGAPCSHGTDAQGHGNNTNLVASLTGVVIGSNVIALDNSLSTTDATHKINFRKITQTSGTALNLGVYTGKTDTITGVATGTYGFQQMIVDGGWDTVFTTFSITVSGSQNYWVSSSIGNDTHAGTSPATAFKTLGHVALLTLIGGDTIFLKRGDTFPEQMVANGNGAVGNPIVYKPYGSGPQPIIGGMTAVTGWSNVSTNLWQATYTGNIPNLLAINGVLQTVSRNPNSGYFNFTSYTGSSLTDIANSGAAPIGSRIRVRSAAQVLDSTVVTSNSTGIVGFSPSVTYTGQPVNGWFVTNNQPDTIGEWRYITNALQLYSLSNPGSTVTVPTVDTPLLSEGTHLEFDSLNFVGGNYANTIFAFQSISNIVLNADSLIYGYDGMQLRSEGTLAANNIYIAHMSNNGVLKQNTNNYNNTFISPVVNDIGMIAGMGRGGNLFQNYSGIIAGDSGSTVKNGTITNIGAIAVANYGSGFDVDSTLILKFCQVLEDQGAIYTWMNAPATFARQRRIVGNIVGQGGSSISHLGMTSDFSSAANGIYLDNFTSNVLVQNNTVFLTNSCLFYDHGPSNIIRNNTGLDGLYAQLFLGETGPVISGMVIKNNIFAFTHIGPFMNKFFTTGSDIPTFASMDSNTYLVPIGGLANFFTQSSVDAGTNRNLSSWQSNTGYDLHGSSVEYAPLLLMYSVPGGTFPLPGLFIDAQGNQYNGTITLGRYSSVILRQLSTWNLNLIKGSLINLH